MRVETWPSPRLPLVLHVRLSVVCPALHCELRSCRELRGFVMIAVGNGCCGVSMRHHGFLRFVFFLRMPLAWFVISVILRLPLRTRKSWGVIPAIGRELPDWRRELLPFYFLCLVFPPKMVVSTTDHWLLPSLISTPPLPPPLLPRRADPWADTGVHICKSKRDCTIVVSGCSFFLDSVLLILLHFLPSALISPAGCPLYLPLFLSPLSFAFYSLFHSPSANVFSVHMAHSPTLLYARSNILSNGALELHALVGPANGRYSPSAWAPVLVPSFILAGRWP